MSLFESSITGNVLNDGSTTEISGITAGQLATVLTAYTPLTETATNAASISANATGVANNAAAIAALQAQVDNLPAPPDLAPYALASDLAAAEGLIAANASSITALNTSLTTGLAGKGEPVGLGHAAAPGGRQEHPGKRRRQTGELLHNSGHEFGYHQRQQRNPGQRGNKLRPLER